MKAVGVIPARWGSTRFLGKPLALIHGKPLLQWVIEGAKTSRKLSEICVATDDERIAQLARSCGARAVMTDSELPTGTDRVWQAARELDAEVFVNVQGDEPLIEGALLDRLVEPFEMDAGIEMATLGRALDETSLLSENTAKIVLNRHDEALYFSRFPIPYSRQKATNGRVIDGALKHIGIYAYRRSFLEKFCAQVPTPLEVNEGLEQLRALYLGARIKVVRVEHDSWGVDVPEDVQKIETILNQRSNEQLKKETKGQRP
jgi:3-deoxy-manno-octulosonate cytidylyltransferase (CMP-KDO synthetase)